jgi:phage gpG-like protein
MSPRAAPLEMEVKQRGAGKAAVDVHRVGDRSSDIRRLSEKVRSVYRRSETARFDNRGRGAWPPLAASTRARKAAEGLDPRILHASDTLYRSLTSPRAAGQIDDRKPTEFRFGTTVPYAVFHDVGKGLPRRELIELTPSERREVEELIARYISKGEGA